MYTLYIRMISYQRYNMYNIYAQSVYIGNQLNPESLFQKDLDIDPFVASTPEQIQEDYDAMQVSVVYYVYIILYRRIYICCILCAFFTITILRA